MPVKMLWPEGTILIEIEKLSSRDSSKFEAYDFAGRAVRVTPSSHAAVGRSLSELAKTIPKGRTVHMLDIATSQVWEIAGEATDRTSNTPDNEGCLAMAH